MTSKIKIEIGSKYNLLTVVDFNGTVKCRPTYLCRCACGKYTIVEGRNLPSEKTKSCGCLRSYIASAHMGLEYKQYIGKRFDRLLVLEYNYEKKKRGAYLLCQCDCGEKKIIPAKRLTHLQVKSCGCKLAGKII